MEAPARPKTKFLMSLTIGVFCEKDTVKAYEEEK